MRFISGFTTWDKGCQQFTVLELGIPGRNQRFRALGYRAAKYFVSDKKTNHIKHIFHSWYLFIKNFPLLPKEFFFPTSFTYWQILRPAQYQTFCQPMLLPF
jgi:hypothetical protein